MSEGMGWFWALVVVWCLSWCNRGWCEWKMVVTNREEGCKWRWMGKIMGDLLQSCINCRCNMNLDASIRYMLCRILKLLGIKVGFGLFSNGCPDRTNASRSSLLLLQPAAAFGRQRLQVGEQNWWSFYQWLVYQRSCKIMHPPPKDVLCFKN